VNEYGRHFEFYITLDAEDRFEAGQPESGLVYSHHYEKFLEGEFDPLWNLRYLQSFKINTHHDLERLNDMHDIPVEFINNLLDRDKIRVIFNNIMIIRSVYDKDKIGEYIKPFNGTPIQTETTIEELAKKKTSNMFCIYVAKNKQHIDSRNIKFLHKNRIDIDEYQLFIPVIDYNKLPDRYRLYLNDRVLTERIYETKLEHDRRCYAESIWIKNEPAQGFNFTLATDLNLTIAAVDIDGVRHPVNAKTFTYTPDK
jgi:hypothetical protein